MKYKGLWWEDTKYKTWIEWYSICYLQSDYWKWLKDKVLEYFDHECVRCGSQDKLLPHHKHYKTLGKEKIPDDIECICFDCHIIGHGFKFSNKVVWKKDEKEQKLYKKIDQKNFKKLIEKYNNYKEGNFKVQARNNLYLILKDVLMYGIKKRYKKLEKEVFEDEVISISWDCFLMVLDVHKINYFLHRTIKNCIFYTLTNKYKKELYFLYFD